ncbi:Nudix family hydrolase [Amantichitinum ursilacus]|uniref:8-oxo-dGTP diphosphatase n=1 Tax=Amantichitinum ursilacus TaxID=857265 RepID=A0A0N0GNZ2_9NEIS|nr:Nudix family hydrolase [Amantichitinum ursilacus]KPC53295.1 8-oxo-dGTP diphosphatase [Amantichitinum ursilacus]
MSTAPKVVDVAVGVLVQADGQFLLGSRPAGKPYAGYWEFPGGKLEDGETALQALQRELQEEMGIVVTAATPWLTQRFVYPHATVRLHFFRVTAWEGEFEAREGQQFAWQSARALTVSPILPANGPIMRGLQLPPQLALSQVAGLGEAAWLARLQARLSQANPLWLILREPQLAPSEYGTLAEKVIAPVHAAGGRVLLHNHIDLARELRADGVHVSVTRAAELQARPRGLDWFGASVHNATELQHAQQIGVDYAMLGHVLPTNSHAEHVPLGWDGFEALMHVGWPFPLYALGGLSNGDLPTALQHGAHGIGQLTGAWR